MSRSADRSFVLGFCPATKKARRARRCQERGWHKGRRPAMAMWKLMETFSCGCRHSSDLTVQSFHKRPCSDGGARATSRFDFPRGDSKTRPTDRPFGRPMDWPSGRPTDRWPGAWMDGPIAWSQGGGAAAKVIWAAATWAAVCCSPSATAAPQTASELAAAADFEFTSAAVCWTPKSILAPCKFW